MKNLLDMDIILERKSFADEDDPEFWNMLLSHFYDTSPLLLADLRQAVETQNLTQAGKKTHELLGVCRNIGARQMSVLLDAILQNIRKREQLPPLSDIDQIAQVYAETQTAFRELND